VSAGGQIDSGDHTEVVAKIAVRRVRRKLYDFFGARTAARNADLTAGKSATEECCAQLLEYFSYFLQFARIKCCAA
jgi:hypothetical protein